MRSYLLLFGWAGLAVALAGCGGGNRGPADVLRGTITVGGRPAAGVQVVATTADGRVAGGTSNENGEYRMPDAPRGSLQVRFASADSLPPGSVRVPPRYRSATVPIDYSGGVVTKDFDLTP
ncbi:MAG: carboxypeptidase-like regulatory domain-containing protein [Gemmataceae bacterium]